MYRRIRCGVMVLCTMMLLAAGAPLRADESLNFQILEPRAEQSLQSQFSISIAFQNKDNTPVVRFDAYLGTNWLVGGRIVNPIPAGSFKVDADISAIKVPPGINTLYVKLVDSQGRVSQREQKIVLSAKVSSPEHFTPTVHILNPKNGTIITANSPEQHIRVEASDPSGIKWVFVYINDKLYALQDKAPFEFTWNPFQYKWSPGSYTLRARAVDMFENEGNSESVTVQLVGKDGRTYVETVPSAQLPADVVGVFVPTVILPSMGASIPRLSYSNVVSPLGDWLANAGMLPTIFSPTRSYSLPLADAEALAILPPKVLPELQAQALHQAGAGSYPEPLPLAGLSRMAPHPLLNDSPLQLSQPLWLPDERPWTEQPVIMTYPGNSATFTPPQKGTPGYAEAPVAASSLLASAAVPAPALGGTVNRPAFFSQTPGNMLVLPDGAPATPRQEMTSTSPMLYAGALPTVTKRAPRGEAMLTNSAADLIFASDWAPTPSMGGMIGRPANAAPSSLTPRTAPSLPQHTAGQARAAVTGMPVLIALVPVEMEKRAPVAGALPQDSALSTAATPATLTPSTGHTAARATLTGTTPARVRAFLPRPDMDTAGLTTTASTPEKRTPVVMVYQAPLGFNTVATQTTPQTGTTYPRSMVRDATPQHAAAMSSAPATQHPARAQASSASPRPETTRLPGKRAPESYYPANVVPVVILAMAPSPSPTSGAGRLPMTLASENVDTHAASLPPARQPAVSYALSEHPQLMPTMTPGKAAPSGASGATAPMQIASTGLANPSAGAMAPRPSAASSAEPNAILQVQAPYTVQPGDTLVKIAAAHATTPDALTKLNPGLSPSRPLPVNTMVVVPKPNVHIYLDDSPLTGCPTPFISHGNAMLPFRKVVEAKKGTVVWLPQTKEINAWANHTYMKLKIGDRQAHINNDVYELPVAAVIVDARTMVPVRYLMTALKLQVEYNAASGAYYLVSRLAQ